jgi:hypothetical protein
LAVQNLDYKSPTEFIDQMLSVCPNVHKEVFIQNFKLSATMLTNIFRACRNVHRLSLAWCYIGDGPYTFDSATTYSISQLQLGCYTITKSDSNRLDESKLPSFASALAKTSLKDSLTKVYVYNHSWDVAEIEQIFHRAGCDNLTVEDNCFGAMD